VELIGILKLKKNQNMPDEDKLKCKILKSESFNSFHASITPWNYSKAALYDSSDFAGQTNQKKTCIYK